MRRLTAVVLALVVVLGACSGGSGGSGATNTPEPTEGPTVAPTPKPWSLEVTSAKYAKRIALGATFDLVVKVKNSGTAANDSTKFQLSGLDDYLDFSDCTPDCSHSGFLGDTYLVFDGVKAGKTATFTIELVATKLGRADWSLTVYDGDGGGEDDFYAGEGATTVSG